MKTILPTIAVVLLLASPAFTWNVLGHKVVCEIAWQQIDRDTRENIVADLMR